MKKTALISSALWAAPLLAFAQVPAQNLRGLITLAGDLLNMVIPVLIAAALVVFFIGLVKYVWNNSGEDSQSAKNIMIAGLVSLFVMVSVWGIIRLAQNTLGVQGNQPIQPPAVPLRR